MTAQEELGLKIYCDGLFKEIESAFTCIFVRNRDVKFGFTLNYMYHHSAIRLTANEGELLGDVVKRCIAALSEKESLWADLLETISEELKDDIEALNAFDRAEYIDLDEVALIAA